MTFEELRKLLAVVETHTATGASVWDEEFSDLLLFEFGFSRATRLEVCEFLSARSD